MSTNLAIRVMVVDDHTLVRQGIVSLLEAASQVQVVAEARDGQQAVELYRQHRPDVTLMDLRMPLLSGPDAITTLRTEFPRSRFIVLTTYNGDEDVYRAIEAGAQGYLLKDVSREQLVEVIQKVHAGGRWIPADVAGRVLERATSSFPLTDRESAILRLMVDGLTNRDIATRLSVSEETIKWHARNLFGKLVVENRTQAALAAVERGLFRID